MVFWMWRILDANYIHRRFPLFYAVLVCMFLNLFMESIDDSCGVLG